MAATKTANVNARIDINVKTQAEAILSKRVIGQNVLVASPNKQEK